MELEKEPKNIYGYYLKLHYNSRHYYTYLQRKTHTTLDFTRTF